LWDGLLVGEVEVSGNMHSRWMHAAMAAKRFGVYATRVLLYFRCLSGGRNTEERGIRTA
jgi:hypothetical protein